MNHPNFVKVAQFGGDGAVQIFEVISGDFVQLNRQLFVDPSVIDYLDRLQTNRPDKYQALLSSYFERALGWHKEEVAQLKREASIVPSSQPVSEQEYVFWV